MLVTIDTDARPAHCVLVERRAMSDRYASLQSRYEALSARAAAGQSLVPNTAYADFLKEQEKEKASVYRTGAGSDPGQEKDRNESVQPRPVTSQAIRSRAENSLEETAKRLKVIEDHMWQHKQQERELRRAETDVLRQRKQLERSAHQYDAKAAKLQQEGTKAVLEKEEGLTMVRHKDTHTKAHLTRDKIQRTLVGRQKLNEHTKKLIKSENQLAWKYRHLLETLERKKQEVDLLSKEFESKLRSREQDEHAIMKELTSLAITLNMEAQKTKNLEAEEKRHMDRDAKKQIKEAFVSEEGVRATEKEVVHSELLKERKQQWEGHKMAAKHKSIQSQHRQEGRHLNDIKVGLQSNMAAQWYLQSEAERLVADRTGHEVQARLQAAESKRRGQLEEFQRKRHYKNTREMEEWERRKMSRESEARKRAHEDRIKQLVRVVAQQESIEHSMYRQVKEAEAHKTKKEQALHKLQEDLESITRENAKQLKTAVVQAKQAEMKLQQKIQREAAELSKAANRCEEGVRSIVVHRLKTSEDKHMLAEEKKELQRCSSISSRDVLLHSV
ncbi:hypothetical protein EMCRGX_G006525 [Ephydatia muelleri]|eukprot:Em0002g1865a